MTRSVWMVEVRMYTRDDWLPTAFYPTRERARAMARRQGSEDKKLDYKRNYGFRVIEYRRVEPVRRRTTRTTAIP